MRKAKSKFSTVAGIALVALMSTISFSGALSAAEGNRKQNGVSVNIESSGANRGLNNRQANRGFGNREGRRFSNEQRRYYSYNNGYGNDNYRRYNRRNRGLSFGGISIDLGSIDSSCRRSYRKWQNTGSRYWRRQYYDCIG